MSTPRWMMLWTLAFLPFSVAVLAHLRGSSPTLSVTRPVLPALAFDQYLVDLGPVRPAAEIGANFVFRHHGLHPAKILEIKPSCGCLQPRLRKMEYEPGESDVLVMRIYPANETPGKHEYFVDLKYADPEPREIRLTFRVDLPEKGISIKPPAIMVYQFSNQEPTVMPVMITETRQESWSIQGVSVSLPFVNITTGDPIQAEGGAREYPLEVTVSAAVPSGRHRGLITVYTDDATYPELKIPLMVQGPIAQEATEDATAEHTVP